ncbi:sensor histidine kinase [Halapricum hydrolyticum]|uniref:histidine kinase n=1 Tax=Halapricum hydrolyticum TaxID=2979991 RepID=A0AAE3IGR0_9EURY|nr:ATP-binding protein [Halapricum hydrolyticum]MCU4719361.1 ATP-binding protein [Halapricum hydrolyticum]MCU4728374.1 ATP-binding protein [Halapricum hydrolyticum]
MVVTLGPSLDPLFVAYVAVFAAAAVASYASVAATPRIEDPDTRRGLAALLLTTGGWATAHVGFLLAPTADLSLGFYTVGLIVGLAAVGPWLYFTSAYTGRTLHRDRNLQVALVAVFLVIVAMKVTNPYHHLYYEAAFVTYPFPHLAVRHQLFHWLVLGLTYGLSIIGYFMLFERFRQVSYDTRPLLALVGVTALPVALDVVGFATPYLIDITYEPIGVAVFAVGLLFVYFYQFQAVQVTGGRDEPTILLDQTDRVREYNDPAESLFPCLQGGDALGEPLWSALPEVADALETDESIVALERSDGIRYYRVSERPFAVDRPQLGRLIVLRDVTERERYRRELERQNDRLESFASMVSHDLRNPLSVAMARLELARAERDDEHLETVADALARMERLIDDVLALARQGQPIDEPTTVSLATLAEDAWAMVDAIRADLDIVGEYTLAADSDRLQQLLENLFRNAVEHGPTASGSQALKDAVEHGSTSPDSQARRDNEERSSSSSRTQSDDAVEHGHPDADTAVTVRIGPLSDGEGFYVEDDGQGIPESERANVFESGYSTATTGTGFGLAIIDEIVTAHGWEIEIAESNEGGARFEIRVDSA